MNDKTIFLFPNPEFDKRTGSGISRLYQIFSIKYGYNLKIVNLEFLEKHIPEQEYSQILVTAGGDGTFHRVINTIPDEAFNKYIFGIIPAGTANEFARALHIPITLEGSAEIIARPKKISYQHLGIINNQNKFATGILYGIASEILLFTPKIAKHYLGHLAFQVGFLRVYAEYLHPWGGFIKKFKINSREFRTNYLLINNASLISKGLKISEIDSEDKNKLSLIYIHSRLKISDILRILIKHGIHYRVLYDPALYYEQFKEAKLEFEGENEFLLDGDLYKFYSPLNIQIFNTPISIITG